MGAPAASGFPPFGIPAQDRFRFHRWSNSIVASPRGALVYGVLSSANRDETPFEDADCLDLAREKNRHLAFGQGIHYCLGAPLARLEGQIALRRLVERMPRLRLAVPEPSLRWRKGLNLRGLEELPVVW